MWPFRKLNKTKQKEFNCSHDWVVTENLNKTLRDLCFEEPIDITNVSRICKKCLIKENHTVNGHIDYSKAFTIFGGKEEEK